MAIRSKNLLIAAMLITTGAGLSGCVYDVGLGFASDGYYDNGYGCDPYGGYDAYYDCDYGQGFANIGFGGGWYDNYYYPGYGFFVFDNVGRRYPMRDHHRSYWGEKRHDHYREHRSRDRDGLRYGGRERDYGNDAPADVIGRREGDGDRVRNGNDRRDARREGRRDRNGQWRGGNEGRGANAVPFPNTGVVPEQTLGSVLADPYARGGPRADAGTDARWARPQRARQEMGAPPPAIPAPRAAPAPRPERVLPNRRSNRDEGENVRDQ